MAVVPRINRLSSSRQPPGVFPYRFDINGISDISVPGIHSGQLSAMLWGAKKTVVSWANRPAGSRPAPARPFPAALLCAALLRSACGMTVFLNWQINVYYQPGPKPGHTTGGSGRGKGRGGGAGSGRTGRRQNSSSRRQASLIPPKASKTRRLNGLQKREQAKPYLNRMREQNHQLTTGS